METAMNNSINRFNAPRRAPARSAASPLDECRDMALRRLLDDYAEALRLAAGKLVGLAEEAAGDRYHLCTDALQLVRDHTAEITKAFRGELIDRYNEARRHVAGGSAAPSDSARLSLVEQDDLEESLAAQSMAHALRNACGDELFALNRRIGLLLEAPDMDDTENPLGPEVIGASVMASLNALENQLVGIKVRLLAMRVLTQTLPERARATYQDLNRQLVRRGILPVIKPVLIKARQEAAVAAQPTPSVEDPLAVLRGLLGGLTAGQAGQGGEEGAPAEPLMRVLERMQRMESGDARRAKPGATPRAELNILSSIKRLGGAMSTTSAMTLDVVALLFDFVLEDRRIPDAMKALIGRLQIPYLKAAILDPDFFSDKAHPARQLLDGLAEAALGWDADEGHEGGLYQVVDRLVRDILKRFDQNVEVFAEALAALRGHLGEEERLARVEAERGARVVQAREMDALARREARDVVRDRLNGRVVPGAIRAFLTRFWASLLADLYRDAGLESRAWVEAVKTIDDLVWSVEPKSSQEERKRLVENLPDLLQRLDEGMQSLGMTRKEHDRFFATMVKCHAEAVRAGQQNDAPHAAVSGDVAAEPEIAEAEEDMPAPRDFQAVEAPESDVDDGAAPLAESAPTAPLGLTDGIAGLKPGAWIEYRQEDGTTARARLFWISPLGGIYLFTNRLGQRAISISADGLAEKLRAGEASIVDSTPLIDRAVSRAIDKLRHAAPKQETTTH